MATVIVHRLASSKKALVACQLVEELYLAGEKVVVFLADQGRAATWDQYLWTFAQNSFVPHAAPGAMAGCEDAVVIAAGQLPAVVASRVLVIVDGFPPVDRLVEFEEVHDLVAPTAEDANRRDHWTGLGLAVVEVDGAHRGPRRPSETQVASA